MQNLSNLSPAVGSHRGRKRLGRGTGSGLGKTAGRGHKGQKARKSPGPRPGFEGGQTPLYRRIPKRGFTNRGYQHRTSLVQLCQLDVFSDGSVVSMQDLWDRGWIKGHRSRVKVLASDDWNKALTVHAHAFSSSAKSAIELAGGRAVIVDFVSSDVGYIQKRLQIEEKKNEDATDATSEAVVENQQQQSSVATDIDTTKNNATTETS